MFSIMTRGVVSRNAVIGVLFAVFSLFAVSRFYDGIYNYVPNFSNESHVYDQACRIWPHWNASDRPSLHYDEYEIQEAELLSVGSPEFLGDPNTCLKAESRLEKYRTASMKNLNWDKVQWGQVQKRCAAANQQYFVEEIDTSTSNHDLWRQPPPSAQTSIQPKSGRGRTAVVLRTWDSYNYTDTRKSWLRALITETALHSRGHYEVFLLVEVKDISIELEEDQKAYERELLKWVPEEFRNIAVLWNHRTVAKWYPLVEEHGSQEQMYQALQVFSHQFPHFTHFWQLAMDLRFTGHVYDTLESTIEFAKAQSRHNLWERNGRYYISELHARSYDIFTNAVDDQMRGLGIWGPPHTKDFTPHNPKPPPPSETDWVIGEDSDLIGFTPMIDPVGSDWIYEDEIYGFAAGESTPRRAAFGGTIITRSSRRLLQLVSKAQREKGQWLASEATLESFAFLHGLKAVVVPHQISFANDWTAEKLAENIARGPPTNQAGGWGISSSYTNRGWVEGPWWQSSFWQDEGDAGNRWRAYLAGECLPSLLLYPVLDG